MSEIHLQQWADRMKMALETIVVGLQEYVDDDGPALLTADDVVRIAQRALNPDEWERVHE